MSMIQHATRIGLIMLGASALFLWSSFHAEVTFADGLRYIGQAERLDQGAWADGVVKSVDHPLHPLSITAAHRIFGGQGPLSWQYAAQTAAIVAAVCLAIPLYLVALEIYGPTTAWVAPVLFLANPIMAFVVVNVLSESTFLLFWTWGLWAAVRFLREGRFYWLPLTIGFATLAYLARPEGLLLPLALVATLGLLPLHWSTRIYWPRWWAAVAFLVFGPMFVIGPYMAAKGGIGTKPSIARLLGTAPKSAATALERERPLPPDQTTFETYHIAAKRMIKVVRSVVTTPLLPLVVLGLAMARPWSSRARVWLLTGIILAASALGLIRLHATGGYCTVRHGLIPGMLLTLAAANGLAWLMRSIVIPGRWLGRGDERFRLGPAIWGAILAAFIVVPQVEAMHPAHSSFAPYQDAGAWLTQIEPNAQGKILDLTDWSLFFSRKAGFHFADVFFAAIDPQTRWVVAREAHVRGRWIYSQKVRDLVDGLEPVAVFPKNPEPRQVQILIFDRQARPAASVAKQQPAGVTPDRVTK